MPSRVEIAGLGNGDKDQAAPDLLAAFAQAKHTGRQEAPDLAAAFERAAKSREEGEQGDNSGAGIENARPRDVYSPGSGRKARDPERGR